jgi:hypothetical protein
MLAAVSRSGSTVTNQRPGAVGIAAELAHDLRYFEEGGRAHVRAMGEPTARRGPIWLERRDKRT